MKLLIAGASGFIGKNVLLRAPTNWRITGIYNTSLTFPDFLREHGLAHIMPLRCDLRDRAAVERLFAEQESIFDACLFVMGNSDIGLSARQPSADLAANVTTLLNLAQNIQMGKFVFMSSGTVYLGHQGLVSPETPANPLVPYGITKLASELYIRFLQAKTDYIGEYVILRFFGAYGPMEPRRKIYTNLIKRFVIEKKSDYALRGDGKNYIDAMYIDDAVNGLLRVLTSDKGNLTLDFCRGTPQTINELVREVADILGVEQLHLSHTGESSEYTTFFASPQGMAALFGFQAATSLQEGILKFKDYLLSAQEVNYE